MRKIEPQPKGSAPNPLYVITYSVRKPKWLLDTAVVKVIHFQTDKQYLSWLKNSYATAQDEYEVTIEKRNDEPRKEGREYYRYNKIYPNYW